MTYVNRYIEADNNTTVVYKTVKINEYTYVLGNTKRPDTGIFAVPYIACIDETGTMLWEHSYSYPGITNGYSHWDVSHVEDLLAGESPEILYALVYDMNSVILLRIDANEGSLQYFNKVYDRYDTPFYSQKLGIKARLHKFDDNSMVVNVHEIHSDNSNQVVQIDYCLMKIHPYEIIAYNVKRIVGAGLELNYRHEEVRNGMLHLFGGVGKNDNSIPDNGIITLVDEDINIALSNVLTYPGQNPGQNRDYLDIYSVSRLHDERYLVIGSYHRFRPQSFYAGPIRSWWLNLPFIETPIFIKAPIRIDWVLAPVPMYEEFTHYFIAEISEDSSSVKQAAHVENKNFDQNGDHHVFLNDAGYYFSKDSYLYSLRSDLSSTQWTREIFSTEENRGFTLNEAIENYKFTSWLSSYYNPWEHRAFYLASTDLEYESCKTRPVNENLNLSPLDLRIEEFPLYTQEARVGYYDIEVYEGLNNLGTEFLCGNDPDPDPEDIVLLDAKSRLQSAHLTLQSVGSQGTDSTAGIHVRWQFKRDLMQHLPKGNHYQGAPQGFNKPNDFVRLMRAPYQPVVTVLDFAAIPKNVNNTARMWSYQFPLSDIYILFRDAALYDQALLVVNPAVNPLGFIQNYGEGLIEIDYQSDLFFAVQLTANTTAGTIRTEVLSVETRGMYDYHTSLRKTLTGTGINEKIFIDNGSKLRFSAQGNFIRQVSFEYYTSFINTANSSQWWQLMDYYSLTDDTNVAFNRLEPDPGGHAVHARWPRYNEGQFVNTDNYRQRWHGPMPDPRNTVQNSVRKYMELSADPNNAPANETYYLNDVPVDGSGMDVSHLTLLQMASMDFHVARMLGLGSTDVSGPVFSNTRFVYVAVYTTFAALGTAPATELRHIAMGLPTSLDDNRPALPIDLAEPRPGIFTAGQGAGEFSEITGPNGYSHDGKTRYISLYAKEIVPNEPINIPFFYSTMEFNISDRTFPVYVGIKYSDISQNQWLLPELSHDPQYFNVNSSGGQAAMETVGIPIPDPDNPAYIHKITRSGRQFYGSYGIDWFSRGSVYSSNVHVADTLITQANTLLAPSSVNAFLIEPEAPLLLTSVNEQQMLVDIPTEDKTFIRLLLEYDTAQDMVTYLKAVNGQQHQDFDPLPINDEIFADSIEIFFRPEMPKQLFGTIASVADNPGNPLISIITTAPMVLGSSGTNLYPEISAAEIPHYIGSVFSSGGEEFIIHQVVQNPSDPQLPELHVLKKHLNSAFGGATTFYDPTAYLAPQAGESFMIVENMLNEISWGAVNPISLTVDLGSMWQIHEEEVNIEAGQGNDITLNTYLRRFRGFAHEPVEVEQYINDFTGQFEGMYRLVFEGFILDHHPQYSDVTGEISVDWYRGSVRVPYEDNPDRERKTLKIIRMDQVGGPGDLIVYAQDENYQDDPLQSTAARTAWVNLYPGYRCYLYEDGPSRLTEEHIYPQDENVLDKYSIFGTRSRLQGNNHYISDISVPSMMFARRHEEPQTPEIPTGGIFATKPDYYGRSSFTFNTKYTHKPFALSFVRTNDDLLLSSFYKQTPYDEDPATDSVEDIRKYNDDEFFTDRLLALANLQADDEDLFPVFGGYRFPVPNNQQFFDGINVFIDEHNTHYGDSVPHVQPGNIDSLNQVVIPEVTDRNAQLTFLDFMREIVSNAFVPLTEIPVIYNYIKGSTYQPVPKLQVVRDRNGALLKPTDPDFDIAPMAKVLDTNPHKTQFTDFTLDGNSTAVYFYAVREVNSQMQQGSLSEVIGPVRMVNSYAVQPPEIVSIVPVLENTVLGITPKVEITINAYDAIRKIKKLNLYRTFVPANVHDLRTMDLIRTINLEDDGLLNDTVWKVTDDFSDLPEVPFGDPMYYRITVEAEIQYAEANYTYDDNNPNNQFDIVTDFAAGSPSKLIITTVPESAVPESPDLTYTSQVVDTATIGSVAFQWDKQAYKGKYYLYKMNTQGNWVQIAMVAGNADTFELNLIDTDWNTDQLVIKDADGNTIYHHFKMLAENTAGMFSIEEKVQTIPSV